MDNPIKDNIKRFTRETEIKLTGFLLRWKEQKEGKGVSDRETIEMKSRIITDTANEILKRRGKNIFTEIKNIYIKKYGQEGKDN